MLGRLAGFVAVAGGGGAGLVSAVAIGCGASHWLPGLVALALCLVSAAASLGLIARVARLSSDGVAAAVLAAMGLRMAGVVAGVVLLSAELARFGCPPDRFAGWAAGLYVYTLAVESAYTVRIVRAATGATR